MRPAWPRPQPGDPSFGTQRAELLASLSNAVCTAFNSGLSDEEVLDVVLCEVHAWQDGRK